MRSCILTTTILSLRVVQQFSLDRMGRGKSHLLLILSALTSLDLRVSTDEEKKHARHIQYELCEKIALVDKEVGALAKAIVDSEIRTPPCNYQQYSTDINQSFLIAINEALRSANLQDLLQILILIRRFLSSKSGRLLFLKLIKS